MDGIRPAQTLILWAIRENAQENGGVAEISMRELSKRCFVGLRTVQYALSALEESGSIAIERTTGRWNDPQVNRYRVLHDYTDE